MSFENPADVDRTYQPLDLARLAAYLDGEGCINISSIKSKTRAGQRQDGRMQVTIGNTDPRLARWLISTFGGDAQLTTQGRTKKFWYWRKSGRYAAALLIQCLPYFIMKRDQAEVAIAYQELVTPSRKYGARATKVTLEAREQRTALMLELREVRRKSTFLLDENVPQDPDLKDRTSVNVISDRPN